MDWENYLLSGQSGPTFSGQTTLVKKVLHYLLLIIIEHTSIRRQMKFFPSYNVSSVEPILTEQLEESFMLMLA